MTMELFLGVLTLLIALSGLISLVGWLGKRKTGRLTAGQKSGWLLTHMIFVIMFTSGFIGILLLAVYARVTTDRELIYAAYLFNQYFDWFLIIPGGMGSLITGTWIASRTHWGLTRHYWIIAKIIATVSAITYGGNVMRYILHDNFHVIFPENVDPLQNQAFLHNQQMLFIGLAVCSLFLAFLFYVSYFKPWRKRRPVLPSFKQSH